MYILILSAEERFGTISIVVLLAGIISLAVQGLNLGIDFTGEILFR